MRGGDLKITTLNGSPWEPTEVDFSRMDQIQVHIITFLKRNLYSTKDAANRAVTRVLDEGFAEDARIEDLTRITQDVERLHRLNAALGRVQTDNEVRWLTSDEWHLLKDALWTQDHGRGGARNRWMGRLAEKLQEQVQTFKDIQQYEGEPLPDRIPLVLDEGEWAQIDEDAVDWLYDMSKLEPFYEDDEES